MSSDNWANITDVKHNKAKIWRYAEEKMRMQLKFGFTYEYIHCISMNSFTHCGWLCRDRYIGSAHFGGKNKRNAIVNNIQVHN